MSAGKGKRMKGKTVDITTFLGESMPTTDLNWAQEVENSNVAPMQVEGAAVFKQKLLEQRHNLPSAPRASRGPQVIDLSSLPVNPPFSCRISNISYNATEYDLESHFAGVQILDIKLMRDQGNRLRGYGFIELGSREDMATALRLNNVEFMRRDLRVEVNEQAESRANQNRDRGSYGNRGNDRDRGSHAYNNRDDSGISEASEHWRDDAVQPAAVQQAQYEAHGRQQPYPQQRAFPPPHPPMPQAYPPPAVADGYASGGGYRHPGGDMHSSQHSAYDDYNRRPPDGRGYNQRGDDRRGGGGYGGNYNTLPAHYGRQGFREGERERQRRYSRDSQYSDYGQPAGYGYGPPPPMGPPGPYMHHGPPPPHPQMYPPQHGNMSPARPLFSPGMPPPHPPEPSHHRKPLELLPRTKPLPSADGELPPDDTSQETRASIFGGAKPVDTAAREREIEEKLARERAALANAAKSDRGSVSSRVGSRRNTERTLSQSSSGYGPRSPGVSSVTQDISHIKLAPQGPPLAQKVVLQRPRPGRESTDSQTEALSGPKESSVDQAKEHEEKDLRETAEEAQPGEAESVAEPKAQEKVVQETLDDAPPVGADYVVLDEYTYNGESANEAMIEAKEWAPKQPEQAGMRGQDNRRGKDNKGGRGAGPGREPQHQTKVFRRGGGGGTGPRRGSGERRGSGPPSASQSMERRDSNVSAGRRTPTGRPPLPTTVQQPSQPPQQQQGGKKGKRKQQQKVISDDKAQPILHRNAYAILGETDE